MTEGLVAKVVYIGPSAVNVTMAYDLGIPPASEKGKAFYEAASRDDMTEAARIATQRTRDTLSFLPFAEENPGDEKQEIFSVVSGACLAPRSYHYQARSEHF